MVFRRTLHEIIVHPNELVAFAVGGEVRLAREAVAKVIARHGLLWDSVYVEQRSGGVLRVRGLPRGSASTIADVWMALGLAPLARQTASEFRRLLERDAYFNRAALEQWKTMSAPLQGRIPQEFDALPLPDDIRRDLSDCRRFLADAERLVDERNDEFVASKKREHAGWFVNAGGNYGLTEEQQEAVLRDEDNCLVVAGAGTGKTSTVAGKVGYLLRTCAADADRILLLSFTKKTVTEIGERIALVVGEAAAQHVRTWTFHRLGVEIVASVDGERPSVSKFADDPEALHAALLRYVKALFEDPAAQPDALKFFAYHQFPYRSQFEFRTAHEYYQYVKTHEFRALQGHKVRSHEELVIANWLHLHGVAYEYERPYPHDTASIRYRQYKPDFYLPEFDLYLEHFGIDHDGNTAPCVNRDEYHAGMAWKRQTHQRFGTRLVETYSYERMDGVLFSALEEKLRNAGVGFDPLPPGAVLADAEEQKLVDPVVKLLATFLNLYKGNLWTLDELEGSARSLTNGDPPAKDSTRLLAFLRVFRRVLDLYEEELAASGEIDFNDMIALATDRVETGHFASPFTHIIVDEFQDLSRGRARLLKALLAQVIDRRLFCVGDDWQSIYRFTGSDIEQMTHFAEAFGFTRRCDLTHAHRFNAELLAASSLFIQRNPKQLTKTLVAGRALGEPPIEVHSPVNGEDPRQLLERVLARIEQLASCEWRPAPNALDQRPRVMLLGRYNFTQPEGWGKLVRRHSRLALEFLTVHGSKGLEADYTVLLDVIAGWMGFPSEIVDDPVLDLVLAGTGEFPNAEERRVFYVALTRAKTRCFLLTDAGRQSKFVEELQRDDYRTCVIPANAGAGVAPACPMCGGGQLLRRQGNYGVFWGCSNFPLCEGKAQLCPRCRDGALVKEASGYRCSTPSCGHHAPLCPSCRQGALLERSGPYGLFLGCTEWRPEGAGPSCGYTRKCRGIR
jgi:DNA helicase-4